MTRVNFQQCIIGVGQCGAGSHRQFRARLFLVGRARLVFFCLVFLVCSSSSTALWRSRGFRRIYCAASCLNGVGKTPLYMCCCVVRFAFCTSDGLTSYSLYVPRVHVLGRHMRITEEKTRESTRVHMRTVCPSVSRRARAYICVFRRKKKNSKVNMDRREDLYNRERI